ncbi:MAG: efflux RND transporter permease subunit [Dongiaceae bacterium]
MWFSELCIRRPVFATVLSLIVMLVGIVSYDRLSVREYPNIDEPVVSVRTDYPGASAEIVETQVTNPLEDSISGIEGIDIIESSSRAEESRITVRFNLERDPDAAANDVRDRVARVRGRLPDEIDEPIVSKVEADASPIIYLAFSSDRHDILEVSDLAERQVRDQLATITGVADVRVFGERRYAMRIWLDRARMAAFGVTPTDVETAILQQNVDVPGGRIESDAREFTVLTETRLSSTTEFEAIILRRAEGYLIRLGDVARIELGPEDERVIARQNGEASVALGVIKQATANPLDVSQAVRDALPDIIASLPPGMTVSIGNDTSIFIERSIEEVFLTIGEAAALVVLVIFFFLRNVRATLIPIVTIPVSLIGAFTLIYMFGFSINTLTLLAFVLAIGLVVDDAIVVLENIYRHIERGMEPVAAAIKGIREIGFAVVAMTLTLAAVFAPIGFSEGRTGRLFAEFAMTLAGAVLISGFVALTLSPMMCGQFLRPQKRRMAISAAIDRGMNGLIAGYRRTLGGLMGTPVLVMALLLPVAIAAWWLYSHLESELAPVEDRGVVVGIFSGPEGATPEVMSENARKLEALYAEVPELRSYFLVVGSPTVSQGISFLRLQPWEDRDRNSREIAETLRNPMYMIPGIRAVPTTPASLGGGGSRSNPVEMVLLTTRTYEELQAIVDRVIERARENPGLINLDSDLRLNKPEIRVEVGRDKAADIGVDVVAIGRTLETMLGGRNVTRFERAGEEYEVIVQVEGFDRAVPRDIAPIFVRASDGTMVELANLVTIEESVAPRELPHFNKLRAATLSASLADGYALGAALAYLEQVVAEVGGPGMQIDYKGQSREFLSASGGLYTVFVLALLFIYLVLAAQFESFLDPFIIMLSVPLAMTGALAALWLTGGTLNVYSQIGLVTLVGLVTKHGILIVEFSNQLRKTGKSAIESVVEAASIRLRPIMMTTGAMVLGALPLALATGPGAESRQQIGWVIVGGMLCGTLFTLFVVPAAYLVFARRHGTVAAEHEPAPAE